MIRVSRTNVAVGGLLAVLGAMPHERFIELRNDLLGAKPPPSHSDLVPVFHALARLMEAFEDDALEEVSRG